MKSLIFVTALALVGCSDSNVVVLDNDEWFCAKTAMVTETYMQPVGNVVMPQERSVQRCVSYQRTLY